ncbi:MAG: Xaa-Pro peptidase family protein [Actinomycetota bacterium]|nr:Xaa-Pro peptidase family protein [Actinomycetota bacterium]
MFDYETRRKILFERMGELGVDLVFLPPSGDLEYLTGFKRRAPAFGNIEYAHSWVTGCFLAPGHEPTFVLPRMVVAFDTPDGLTGDVTVVAETDDGREIFRRVTKSFGSVGKLAIGARTWGDTVTALLGMLGSCELVSADRLVNPMRRVKSPEELEAMTKACRIVDETLAVVSPSVRAGTTELELARDVDFHMRTLGSPTPSFDTGVFSMGAASERDATVRLSAGELVAGMGVSFDFGAVVDGYCSDFGRTVHVGTPSAEYERVYEVVMAAQAAGIAAVRPGVPASRVHAETRRVIVDAGLGEWFRHRTGHCIGLDVHERPFISEEDHTPLEAGMTFTVEPSVFRPGHYGVRVEDVVVCEPSGGRKLNEYPVTLVANG